MRGPVYYDLHIHSCLSPCGDVDMTPNNLVRMAKLGGLSVIALTDHNSCGNVRAAAAVALREGIAFLPGMELCTSEEIHVVCLFPDCDRAEGFSDHVYATIPPIQNRAHIFGEQLLLDAEDRVVGREERLLITASGISVTQVQALVGSWGGVSFPAHIDRSSNSLLSVLGTFPEDCGFDWVEAAHPEVFSGTTLGGEVLDAHPMLQNSDAHYLWDIHQAGHVLPPGDSPLHRLVYAALAAVEDANI